MSDRFYKTMWICTIILYAFCTYNGSSSGRLGTVHISPNLAKRIFVLTIVACYAMSIPTLMRFKCKMALISIFLQYVGICFITYPFGLDLPVTLLLLFLTAAQTAFVLPVVSALATYFLLGLGILLRSFCLGSWGIAPAVDHVNAATSFSLLYLLLGSQLLLTTGQRRARLQDLALLERARESSSKMAEVNMRLQDFAAQTEELTVSKERNRMAREIHDTLGHVLTSIATQLEATEVLIPVNPDRAVAVVRKMKDRVLSGLEEVRSSVAALRQPLPEGPAGSERWQKLAETFAEATGMRVQFHLQTEIEHINPKVDEVIYRIIQEGLTNAYRHGHARVADILIWCERGYLAVRISDNGYGVAGVKEGFGLAGIRERLAEVGGSMGWRSEVGKGFDLGVDIPVKEAFHPS